MTLESGMAALSPAQIRCAPRCGSRSRSLPQSRSQSAGAGGGVHVLVRMVQRTPSGKAPQPMFPDGVRNMRPSLTWLVSVTTAAGAAAEDGADAVGGAGDGGASVPAAAFGEPSQA